MGIFFFFSIKKGHGTLGIIWKPQLRVNNMGVIKPLTQHRHKIILHNCQNIPARHAGPHKSWHYVKEGLLNILMLNISTQDSHNKYKIFCGAERACTAPLPHSAPGTGLTPQSLSTAKQAKRSININHKLQKLKLLSLSFISLNCLSLCFFLVYPEYAVFGGTV